MAYEALYSKGKFPRTKYVLSQIAKEAHTLWSKRVLEAWPSYFGKMAMSNRSGGGGGLKIVPVPGGFKIVHPNKGRYNYMSVLEKGRSRYDMKEALLSGPRARTGKNGRYTIIPLTKNSDKSPISPVNNDINAVITKVGSFKDINPRGEIVTRNRYSYRIDPGMTGKGNVFASEQVYRNGQVKRTFLKFLTVSEKSKGMFYPRIPAYNIISGIRQRIERKLRGNEIRSAVAMDVKSLTLDLLKKQNKS
ncbi:hypothetical protein LEP1GSC050_0105 [Leptospira phage vB_LbrZ_5399-LE1]|uniref:Uncharacterized protein n=1 Tax=Leptospira inadai serovar Lyme TaxID=293084 RepID=A0ABX4YGH4_9LEPT|nr:hypothetical protein [Leptospira inadai]AGS80764.1 hypothetical protein LEP1GSC050_0105 [Leptospira phage vB_LbrZ_5399-LE1]AGS80796.1 hypothetical protein LEP1GSC047_0867 [Leptospira phage vB_LinZ_10-LE1]PNV74363.1 hypothetical protein BES34_014360 [Leptospira inadai serovar Lyme]